MTNKAYAKGYRFENRVQNDLEKMGYDVTSSRGSHSPKDLVAVQQRHGFGCFKCSEVLYIQCKTSSDLMARDEWNNFLTLCDAYCAYPILAWRDEANRIHYWLLSNTRAPFERIKEGLHYYEVCLERGMTYGREREGV